MLGLGFKMQGRWQKVYLPIQEAIFLAVDWVGGLLRSSEEHLPTQHCSPLILTADWFPLLVPSIFHEGHSNCRKQNNLPSACWFSGLVKLVWVRSPEAVQLGWDQHKKFYSLWMHPGTAHFSQVSASYQTLFITIFRLLWWTCSGGIRPLPISS